MSTAAVCPQCGRSFPDEDYCPVHGSKLEPPVASTVEPEAPAGDDGETAGESKLARFMRKFGLRRPTGNTSEDAGNTARAAAADEPPSPLPDVVREKGWRVSGPLQGGDAAGVDRWPVERPTEDGQVVKGAYCRHRAGALTLPSVYLRVEGHTQAHLARVWAHGTVDLAGARADYELVSLPKAGRSLREWLKDSTPSEQRAWHLFPRLVTMLHALAALEVRPLAFEPAWLQYTDDGELWLTTAAALTDLAVTDAFRPELERSALLPRTWAAPELTHQNLVSANAALFSLGQVLAQAAWGQPCSIEEVQKGAVPFQALTDARLARVLMGCLWPRATERWTMEQLLQAAFCETVAGMSAVPPWASLAPGAAGQGFAFAGSSFWRLEDLLAESVKPSRWDEATARLDAMLDWAAGTSWAGQVRLMRQARENGRSADWVLVALVPAVLPGLPLTWRTLDLSDGAAQQSLVGLAQRSLRGSKADEDAMRKLISADLRGAFAHALPET